LRTVLISIFLLSFTSILAPVGLVNAEDSVKIGAMLCLTGPCAETGNSSLRGAEIAVAELNAAGGILKRPLSLVVQDTKEGEQSSSAVTAFKNLTLDPAIKLFLGPTWSNGGLPLVPLLNKRPDLTAISPSLGVADFNEASSNLFNLWPHDDVSSRGLAKVATKLGFKTAALVSAQDPWAAAQAASFKEQFEKAGGKITLIVEPLPSSTDLRAETARIARSNPDMVLLTAWFHMNVAAESLRRLGYEGRFMAVQVDEARLAAARGSLEGTIVARFPSSSKDFLEKFRKKYGEDPATSADTAYDSVMLIAKAARACNCLHADKLQAEMLRTTFDGASGKIELDEKRGVKREPLFYYVSKKSFVILNE
jgi:branched-chain amino acid transport system substrate-binding protein